MQSKEVQRIRSLVEQLNRASDAYYNGQEEQMSNYEWDALFDELERLERETGFVLEDSPTQTAGRAEEGGEKEAHEYPALSLQKSKDVSALQKWAGARPIWLSWKLDGLTLVATYDGGRLSKLLTRGNGQVGTVITFLAEAIHGLPLRVPVKGHLVVRGEAVISNEDFELLNATGEDAGARYANARNLAAGTMSMDVSRLEEVRERRVHFVAFTLVHTDQTLPSWGERMELLARCGFETVEREACTAEDLPGRIAAWTRRVETGRCVYPVDGLVVTFDDTDYAASGSTTGHHASLAGFAYKWPDEVAKTTLDHIEWSCAVSAITPVAVFDSVQLEGTTVSRASLCNLSEMERLGIGADGRTKLGIIKANKIIPKCIVVYEREGAVEIPTQCPVCHSPTQVRVSEGSGVKTLVCTNADCPAKHLKRFVRCVGKNALDIDGLSVKTLMLFINRGWLSDYADLFHLEEHFAEMRTLEGFGKKSVDNLSAALEKSRRGSWAGFLYALCVPMIGRDAVKRILDAIGSEELLRRLEAGEGFADIRGIGEEKSGSLTDWYARTENRESFQRLLKELELPPVFPREGGGACAGLTFVVTGDLHRFPNRDALKAWVEAQGGKVSGSVSGKTDYLINNDSASNSAKNRKAQSLGVPILTEEAFIAQFQAQAAVEGP